MSEEQAIPVIVMRNKSNPERYLASSMESGDWSDENLDVKMDDIHNAYMIVRKDLAAPTVEDFESRKTFHAKFKEHMVKKFGEDAFISLDFQEVCKYYEPINIDISQKQYEYFSEQMEVSHE